VKKTLRIDPKRIYITGLSLGGYGTWTTLGAYPDVFAAALPICAGGNALSKACAIASQNVPVWGFHGTADKTVSYTVTTNMINAINACTPKPTPLAKTTLFSGMDHIIWDKVYKETNALDWLTSFTNGTASTAPTSSAPVVSAGADQTITLPANSLYIQGSASDADGISTYQWTKVSGGTASLSGQTTSKVRAYNLVAGSYVFRLTVKDSKGNSKSDDVAVTVKNSTTTNVAPVAYAGPDKNLLLPATSIKLVGSAKDADGSIASYQWTQYGGPTKATIASSTSPTATFSGLKAGNYYFRLTVKDNRGATDDDNVLVRVVNGTASVINLDNTFDEMIAMAD
jgi:hypothetical protein